MQPTYIVGIDTGGTYTDAVLLDRQTGEVVSFAKSPTTHYDLRHGIGDALDILFQRSAVPPGEVVSVAISSTLATNSVVENKGARVAVIVIGYVKHFKLPVKAVVFVKGGHTVQGQEEEPLDVNYLVRLIHGLKAEVDSYAVCSAMSIRNPTHELVAEKAIGLIDPKPVFCSHRISRQAGMQERAATAGLHARLMPVMIRFTAGVQQAMADRGLHCPVLVIGGNGEPLPADRVQREAGLTAASGPACSAAFGANQNLADCLVVDVGGTTTDIAMIQSKRPLLSTEGCRIGEWKTHVEAVDMHTGGIGGDSHVHLDDKGTLSVGPSRVTPLALAEGVPGVEEWLGTGDSSRLICLYPADQPAAPENEVHDQLLKNGRLTPEMIRRGTGLAGISLTIQLEQLHRKQLIFECGFTPTDALHVLGLCTFGDSSRCVAAAQKLGAPLGISGDEFARLTLEQTETRIVDLIIEYIVQHYWKTSLGAFLTTSKNHPVLGVDFSLKLPLVGIGAAARHLLPNVAGRLKTRVVFPEYCEVGNSIGAALLCNRELSQEETTRNIYAVQRDLS
jgi:N-methylhydantoinase A/oxoprolinase/acetone carboxylase beta subunit